MAFHTAGTLVANDVFITEPRTLSHQQFQLTQLRHLLTNIVIYLAPKEFRDRFGIMRPSILLTRIRKTIIITTLYRK